MKQQYSRTFYFLLIFISFFFNKQELKCANIDFKKDSTYIKHLLNEAQDNSNVNFKKALNITKKALDLANILSDKTILLSVYRTMAIVYENNNYLTEAYSWYEKDLSLIQYQKTASKLDIYLDWAIINKKLTKYEIAREYYQHTLDLATQINDIEIIQYVYTGLGTLYGSISEFDKAIEFHLRSKEIAEKRNNTEGVIFSNINIALVYVEAKNYTLAYSFLQKGYNLSKSTPDSLHLDFVFNAYGQVLNAEQKYPEAIGYHQKALKHCQKKNDESTIAITLSFLADVYTKMAYYKDAEEAFKGCFKYSNYFDFYDQPKLYLSLGNLYLRTNRPDNAHNAFHKSLKMSLNRGFKDLVQKNYLGLTAVYEKMGDTDAALKYILKAETYRDSIFNEDKSKKIAEVQYKYNTEKAEIENKTKLEKSQKEIQALQLSQNRVILYLGSISLFAAIALIFTFQYIKQKNKNNKLLAQKNKEIELKNDRLEKSNVVLKQFAYASAHDLKEPLRSISSFVSIINKRYAHLLPPEAGSYMNFVIIGVKRMESLISALLEYSTVAADIDDVKEPASIVQVLNDIKGNLYGLISEKEAVVEASGVFPIIKISQLHLTQLFQNLVKNAIQFNDKKPFIEIIGKVENQQYIIEIKDNGIGMELEYSDKIFRLFQRLSKTTQYEGTGIGLAVCKQIVDKYEGTIRFDSWEGVGTTFIISFPANLIESNKISPLKDYKEKWDLLLD